MRQIAAVLLATSLASGCADRFSPPTPAPTLTEIKNAAYSGVLPQSIELSNGAYPGVQLLDGLVAFGDLDGRPGLEAAVLLGEAGKGGVERTHVAVLALRAGTTVNLGTAFVGSGVQVRDLRIENGAIVADVIEAGPQDPPCCPTQLGQKRFALHSGGLSKVASETTGALSIEILGRDVWTLVSLDGQPVPPGCSAPTVQFAGIRLASFGGCNPYMGTIEEIAPGRIKVSPLAGGRAMCSPQAMNLDQEFLARLEKVDRYTFVGGRLALTGEARGAPFSMLFERPEPAAGEGS